MLLCVVRKCLFRDHCEMIAEKPREPIPTYIHTIFYFSEQ